MMEVIHLSKLDCLIAGEILCDTESGSSNDEENVTKLSEVKNHPDNKPFYINRTGTEDNNFEHVTSQ